MLIFALVVIEDILYSSCLAQNLPFFENEPGYKVVTPISFYPKLIGLGINVNTEKHCFRRKIHKMYLVFLSSNFGSWSP